MASSNVEYYQKQKELQDFMCEQEQRRQHLEHQLQVYSRSDERLHRVSRMPGTSYSKSKDTSNKAKLRATRLQSYWRKICEDQRRSQQRNDQILKEFDRIDAHLGNLSARTERLRLLKQQYADYIEKTYPQWHQQVLQMKQRKDESQKHHHERATNLSQFSQYTPQKQQPVTDQFVASTSSSQFATQPGQQNQFVASTPAYHQQQQHVPDVSVTPIHRDSRDRISTQVTQESAVYANFTSVTRDSSMPQFTTPPQTSTQQQHAASLQKQHSNQQYVSPSQTSAAGYKVPAEKESDAQLKVSDLQGDISFSSDIPSEVINRPIQSITVEKFGQKVTQEPRVESPDIVSKSTSGQMEPNSADEADDDISNFDEEDIPDDGRQAPTPARQATHVDVMEEMSSPEESPIPTPQPGGHQVLTVPTAGISRSPLLDSELTIDGIIHLIHYVESVIPDALSLEGFYRSTPPQHGEKIEIISKANGEEPLIDLDAEMCTMVILENVVLVIRNLPAGCLLPDAILASSHTINEVQIGRVLSIEAKPLWDCLFIHFLQLIKHKVMTVKEVAAVFVPCLVVDSSDYQDKAYELLVDLLEKKVDQAASPPTPREAAESMRSSQGGVSAEIEIDEFGKYKVPPLKFGSLVDSKQHSDDEDTTMVTPSVPTDGPRVPLNGGQMNKTAAYRNLLSGTMSGQKQPSYHDDNDDDEDDTDDDVEKQFASTLSPRTPRETSSSIPPQPTTAIMSQSRPPQQMEPLSETSSATSPVYVPTGMEKSGKSDAGSTGRSEKMQPFKRPAAVVMISSDLDSETDLDILMEKKQTSQEEDDFFDFYE
ncbi:centrosomal protein kizuna-like isoform X3 [Mytilus californianus]|uniref:centrosomal protein kizuna-like isoform X3 n=1 Tax=Mytilus californianus TaxID=6549 RepID=UPI0022452747|nr:centrosomal protein kizuna-like isoform X3 [Mytilus californianus]